MTPPVRVFRVILDRIVPGRLETPRIAHRDDDVRHGPQKLGTEASHLARRFFESRGWQVVGEQTVTRRGVTMTDFVMERNLA